MPAHTLRFATLVVLVLATASGTPRGTAAQDAKPKPPQKDSPKAPKEVVGIAASDVVTPDNVSPELVRDIYDSAQMDVTLDEKDRFIRLKEEVLARCTLSENKERLQLIAYYKLKKDTLRIDQLELVNRINERFTLIRAGIDKDGELWIDCCLVLKGGVSKKNIVQSTRAFLMLAPKSITECDKDKIVD